MICVECKRPGFNRGASHFFARAAWWIIETKE